MKALQDKFQFTAYGGETLYTAVKQGDFYRVSWDDEDQPQGQGYAPYNIGNVERYVEGGEWTVVNSNKEAEDNINYFAEISGTKGTTSPFTGNTVVGLSTGQLEESLTEKYGSLLGVARPVLETRKIGKDQMHMVNDGFPLALRHLAQIMTWAAEVKQYKLHDWRNLPNPDTEFPSAEYRHSSDNSIQKAEGLSALERVDHESGKLHIGHKVFNALCELELILSGKIK